MRTLLPLLFALALAACAVDSEDGDTGDGSGSGSGDGTGMGEEGGEPTEEEIPEGVLTFMDPCDVEDDRCDAEAELFCFSYNMRGTRCTHECTSPDQCAAPSPGCNGKGVCKAP